jgi:hypothetical protein
MLTQFSLFVMNKNMEVRNLAVRVTGDWGPGPDAIRSVMLILPGFHPLILGDSVSEHPGYADLEKVFFVVESNL